MTLSIMSALATKKTGRQLIEGLFRMAHFPPVHARIHCGVNAVPDSYTMMRGRAFCVHLMNPRLQR
jgi:hypothetical protein